jgi:hypothetical protein
MRLQKDIRGAISGSAPERVPTGLESAVGGGFAGRTHTMARCMDVLVQYLAQHARQRVRT